MARINIEDSLFKEKAFIKLILLLGSRQEALGALVEAFMLAQKFYLTTVNDRLIPFNEWEREEISPALIETGFAIRMEKGFYVRGSKEQFGWLVQRSEAGKTSARNKAEKKSTTVDDRATTVNGSQPLSLSPTLPLSLSQTPALEKNLVVAKRDWVELLTVYNNNRGVLPFAKAWNKTRERSAATRWTELPSMDEWAKVVRYYATSPHHTGQNDRGWMASFDFILQPGRWLQALEAGTAGNPSGPRHVNKAEQRSKGNLDALKNVLNELGKEKV